MTAEENRATVARYFSEVIDGRRDVLGEIFTPDCAVHRPDLPEPIRGVEQLRNFLEISRFSLLRTATVVLQTVAEGDWVSARLTHEAEFKDSIFTPFGIHEAAGQKVTWSAMALFRFEGGRIAEEWVQRDELGLLRQLGVIDRVKAAL
jgi:predicted ester cyclase